MDSTNRLSIFNNHSPFESYICNKGFKYMWDKELFKKMNFNDILNLSNVSKSIYSAVKNKKFCEFYINKKRNDNAPKLRHYREYLQIAHDTDNVFHNWLSSTIEMWNFVSLLTLGEKNQLRSRPAMIQKFNNKTNNIVHYRLTLNCIRKSTNFAINFYEEKGKICFTISNLPNLGLEPKKKFIVKNKESTTEYVRDLLAGKVCNYLLHDFPNKIKNIKLRETNTR